MTLSNNRSIGPSVYRTLFNNLSLGPSVYRTLFNNRSIGIPPKHPFIPGSQITSDDCNALLTTKVTIILPTVNTLIRRRGHYNAWKLLTSSFPVRIEMLRLMNKMSAKILNFWIGWRKPLKFWKCNQCLNKLWRYLLKHVCFILKLKDFCNTCVHFQWKTTNACRHDRDTVSAAHAWFAWQAPSLGQIAYLQQRELMHLYQYNLLLDNSPPGYTPHQDNSLLGPLPPGTTPHQDYSPTFISFPSGHSSLGQLTIRTGGELSRLGFVLMGVLVVSCPSGRCRAAK